MDDLISSLDLIYVPPSKGVYTWNNIRVSPGFIATRMDHFLINSSFLLTNSLSSKIILWSSLYHHPISLLFENASNWDPSPFRFNPIWMEKEYFLPLISIT
jgi:hypothetical protein